jgi:hypothetical protein
MTIEVKVVCKQGTKLSLDNSNRKYCYTIIVVHFGCTQLNLSEK